MKAKLFFKTVCSLAMFSAASTLLSCSSPDPTYYTLQPVNGAAASGVMRTIEIRRPGLAGYLDRSDIVIKNASYRLDVNSQLRWAEPLGDMIGRVMTQNLSQRLPGVSVFAQSGAITADAELRVEMDIQGFDADASGQVALTAELAIEAGRSHSPIVTRHVVLTQQPAAQGAGALVATMSQLLGLLSDQIAGTIRQLPRSGDS